MSKLWLNESGLSWWAYMYCRHIKDRPQIRKYITKSEDALNYCRNVKDRPEIRKLIINSYNAYEYCKDIKYDEKLSKIARKGGYKI